MYFEKIEVILRESERGNTPEKNYKLSKKARTNSKNVNPNVSSDDSSSGARSARGSAGSVPGLCESTRRERYALMQTIRSPSSARYAGSHHQALSRDEEGACRSEKFVF